MKHRKFDEIYPYTYYVKHIPTGIKYYGVRYRNVKLGIKPLEDLGVLYFTSIKSKEFSWFRYLFKTNIHEFEYKIHYTFDTREEAIQYELEFATKIFKKEDWANMNAGRAINIYKKSIEDRKEMARKTAIGMLGKNKKPRPKEVIEKILATKALQKQNGYISPLKGAKRSNEVKAKVSQGLKKYFSDNPDKLNIGIRNPMYGNHPTYIAISPTGNTYIIDKGFCAWCKDRNINPSSARRVALGTQLTASGWKFQIANQN